MSDPAVTMKAGIAPYSDGSGHKMLVTIEVETTCAEPTISFESVWKLTPAEWLQAVETVNRLLSALAPADRGGEQ